MTKFIPSEAEGPECGFRNVECGVRISKKEGRDWGLWFARPDGETPRGGPLRALIVQYLRNLKKQDLTEGVTIICKNKVPEFAVKSAFWSFCRNGRLINIWTVGHVLDNDHRRRPAQW